MLPDQYVVVQRYAVVDRGYDTPCWEWLMSTREGYGQMHDPAVGRARGAHVVFWESVHGPVPAGLVLDHLCRNRPCVNPDHLEPVTDAVNTRRGKIAKLTEEQVREIHRRVGERGLLYGLQTDLAREFGVSVAAIHEVVHGHNWRLDGIDYTPKRARMLSEEDEREIRRRVAESGGRHGVQTELAREFGVSPSLISAVIEPSNRRRRLSPEEIDEMRRRYTEAKGQRGIQSALARDFGVSTACVHVVLRCVK